MAEIHLSSWAEDSFILWINIIPYNFWIAKDRFRPWVNTIQHHLWIVVTFSLSRTSEWRAIVFFLLNWTWIDVGFGVDFLRNSWLPINIFGQHLVVISQSGRREPARLESWTHHCLWSMDEWFGSLGRSCPWCSLGKEFTLTEMKAALKICRKKSTPVEGGLQ